MLVSSYRHDSIILQINFFVKLLYRLSICDTNGGIVLPKIVKQRFYVNHDSCKNLLPPEQVSCSRDRMKVTALSFSQLNSISFSMGSSIKTITKFS